MAKKALKNGIKATQNGVCALTGAPLADETALFDTDRKAPKADGGTYTLENTRVVDPVAHQKRHNTLRTREGVFQELKDMVGAREQTLKLYLKINNQVLAYKRNVDSLAQDELEFLESQLPVFRFRERRHHASIIKLVEEYAKVDALTEAALGVRGVGPMTVGYCLVNIDLAGKLPELDEKGTPKKDKKGNPILTDIDKARHASSLWKYAGLDKPSHERYKKGEKGGGNKALRCILWNMAESQVKCGGAYREVYDRAKARLSVSEKVVKSRNTEGILIECAWKDTKPCHRAGAGLRLIMKHFLADWWYVGRTLLGLEVGPLYPEAVLGGNHRTIMPAERGWIYKRPSGKD